MSAATSTILAHPALHSLIHWMNLGGIGVDVGNVPASYQSSASLDSPPNSPLARPNIAASGEESAPHPSVKPGITRSAPVSAPVTVALPVEKFNNFEELNEFYRTWKGIGLAKTAARAILPQGCLVTPKLMVISDIPDDSEDRSGHAFSSASNTVVRHALKAAGIDENAILFSYLSKWRTPAKRPLTGPEKDICARLLEQEIALANPTAILALGESTIRGLTPDSAQHIVKSATNFSHTNQHINKVFTVYASQKSELLVKNVAMKKSFWLSLLNMAAEIRT